MTPVDAKTIWFFRQRRKQLAKSMGKGAIALIPAAKTQWRNHDNPYPFRQSSDFFYLSGFAEPDALLVVAAKGIAGKKHQSVLFTHPNDPEHARWEGARMGVDRACKILGVDQAFALDEQDEQLFTLLSRAERVYLPFDDDDLLAQTLDIIRQLRQKARAGVTAPRALLDVKELIAEQRLIKDELEIKQLRRAAQVSAQGHNAVLKALPKAKTESELAAELIATFTRAGGECAFPSIVAGGSNACVLHYRENNQPLPKDGLVLVDAGAEVGMYAGDITRTWPVSGTFSKPQRELYELVLKAQKAAIATLKPGADFDAPHRAAVDVITRGLIKLGLLKGPVAEAIENEHYKRFFMHRTGHWLGIDVHDVGAYKSDGAWRELKPGMVMTVEPGIYIDCDAKAPARYHGIGIRIEDDVLITADGHEVLTADVPKEIAAIEKQRSSK
ncbi:MAG TPA: M24 family metallopeptidase [Halothiobacillaceae bacterium]|nr:M24 family metallopeptidase [Halothiobacillaceae bacterium]